MESTSAFAFQRDEGEGSARRPEYGLFQSLDRETHLDPFRQFGTLPIRIPSETAVDIQPQPDQWQSHRQESSASPFALATISQQPATPERPETPNWIDQLSRDMGELVVHSESRPVSAHDLSHPEDRTWMDELSRSMGELVMHGEQPAATRLFSAPQLEFRPQYTDLMDDFDDGMNALAAQWQEQAATRARLPLSIRPDESRNVFARPRPPATPQVSLNTLAGDASVLLELFSQRPDDSDNITGEHETMITSAADGISAIQARLRQRGNRAVASREQVSRDADCVICYSNGADVVFMPCKHLVVCTVCIFHGEGLGGVLMGMAVGMLRCDGDRRASYGAVVGALSDV